MTHSGTEQSLVVYPRRWKLAQMALGASALVLVGLFIVFFSEVIEVRAGIIIIIVAYVVAYIGVPFFGVGLIYLLYRLVVRKPALVVSAEGIYDNASALSAGQLRWEEIELVCPYSFGSQRMLGITLKEEQAVLARQNSLKRPLMRVNKHLAGYPINLPQNSLPMTVDELMPDINRYRNNRV